MRNYLKIFIALILVTMYSCRSSQELIYLSDAANNDTKTQRIHQDYSTDIQYFVQFCVLVAFLIF